MICGRGRGAAPSDYVEVQPGNAFITRYLKKHSEVVYVRIKRHRRHRHTEIVGYLAPSRVVQHAQVAWQRHSERVGQHNARVARIQLLGAAADTARDIFLRLDATALRNVFSEYRRSFGRKKCEYAKRQYQEWKARATEMSDDLKQRLLAFLPPYLSFDEKYVIIERIWHHSRSLGTYRFVIDSRQGIESSIETVRASFQTALREGIPANVTAILNWLSEDDAQLAQALAQRFYEKELAVITSKLRVELGKVLEFVAAHGSSSSAQTVIELPGCRISATLRGGQRMSGEHDERPGMIPASPDNVPLVPADPDSKGGQLPVPIENPHDLLGEALRQLPPEKARDLLAKAADKALDLQAKQKEAEIDNAILQDKIDAATRAARQNKDAGTEFKFESDHRSEHSYTRITVGAGEKPHHPPPTRQASGSCFVATACFGDADHPTVLALRSFRDSVLLRSRLGRAFTGTYYRIGPLLAAALDALPFLKPIVRRVLTKLTRVLGGQRSSMSPAE
jgi:hypothetical protein